MPTFGNAQLKLLEKLCNVIAVSGDEGEVRKIVLEESSRTRMRSGWTRWAMCWRPSLGVENGNADACHARCAHG